MYNYHVCVKIYWFDETFMEFILCFQAVLNLEADEHIFKFLLNKFGVGNPR